MRRILICLLLLLCVAPVVLAQESHALTLGQSVDGVIDAEHALRVYSVISVGNGDQRAQIRNTGVVTLNVNVIDAEGGTLATVEALLGGAETEVVWSATAASTSYLMILAGEDVADHQGVFTITLLPPLTLETAGALQFDLMWQAGARLSLEIRDPQGQALHWRSVQTGDGGMFVGGIEDPIDCALFTPRVQRQTATWGQAFSGSYEILVHYIDGCEPSAPFTAIVRLGNQELPPLRSTVQNGETFVTGLTITENARVSLNALSGLVTDRSFNVATANLLAAAQPLPEDGRVVDRITNAQSFRTYQFEGKFGDVISAEARRTAGSLDTYIALMDTNGNLLATNDDGIENSTDSAIEGVRLRRAGTYLLVVTRYAQLLGATEGDFELNVLGVGG